MKKKKIWLKIPFSKILGILDPKMIRFLFCISSSEAKLRNITLPFTRKRSITITHIRTRHYTIWKKKIHHFFFSFLFLEYLFGLYKWPFCLRWARSFLSLLLLFGCLPMEVAIVVSESRFLTFENKVSVKPIFPSSCLFVLRIYYVHLLLIVINF